VICLNPEEVLYKEYNSKMADVQKRQVAYKASVKDLVEGDYVKQEGWQPNYILTKEGRRISRVNLMAAVVSIQDNAQDQKTMLIDDGTGSISVRSFEDTKIMDGLEVGDLIMMVGRPREFGELKYIVPEIIKKIENTKWVDVRQKELETIGLSYGKEPTASSIDAVKEEPTIQIKSDSKSPKQKVYQLIKSLDKGDGVDIDEVINKSGVKVCEKIINALLQEGEIFEIRKGKVKILE